MDIENGKSDQNSFYNKQNNNNNPVSAVNENPGSTEEVMCSDWRGRPSNPNKHGGMRAAFFVLGLQACEIMGIAAVGNNLITYVINEMHFPLSKAANTVTNFIGTIFLCSLIGGHIADSHLGSFWTMLIFGFVELSGFILLSIQAHIPRLKPPKCNMLAQESNGEICQEAKGIQAIVLYIALSLVALGSGCVKPNMIAHGADQFNSNQSTQLSTYFNAAYFAFSIGELIALTVLVWIQTHSGMDIGFGISAIVMAMGLICLVSGTLVYKNKRPRRSIFTPIIQVFVAAFIKRNKERPSDMKMVHGSNQQHYSSYNGSDNVTHTQRFRCLDNACIPTEGINKESPWRLCTINQVQEVKTLISVLPIFACTIIFNTILAQLQTFSVQQGSQMNTNLTHSLTIPPASLQAIPYLLLLFLVPLYDTVFVPFARRLTGHTSGITPLHRIGAGLFISTFSMVAAALMERHRRENYVRNHNKINIFYITPQYLIFGVSEMLTAVGLIEFFYKQSLKGMQSFLMAMTYCSYSFGFYLSSVLVTLINKITSKLSSNHGWLSHNDLNQDRLDLFYWLLAILSFLNFINYLFCATWYSHNPSNISSSQPHAISPQVFNDDQSN